MVFSFIYTSPDGNQYFNPPDNLNYEYFSPLYQLGMGFVIVIGGIVLVATIYLALKNAIWVIMAKGSFNGKFFLWLFIGIAVGLLLIGGGWLGIVSLMHNKIVVPGEEILQVKGVYF